MDIESIRNWIATLALVLSAASIIVVWVKSPGEKIARRLGEFADNLKRHDRRIQRVEDELKHLPSSEDFAELKVAMARVEGRIERVDETCDGLKNSVQGLDSYLRDKK